MEKTIDKEIEYLRIGLLTLYLLKRIERLPKVSMDPFHALLKSEAEKHLGAGGSLVYSRLHTLAEEGFLKTALGQSSNPKAKKPVRVYFLTDSGKKLIRQLEKEKARIEGSLEHA